MPAGTNQMVQGHEDLRQDERVMQFFIALKTIGENCFRTLHELSVKKSDSIRNAGDTTSTLGRALQKTVDDMADKITNGPTLTARHVPHYMRQGLTFPYVGALKLLMQAMAKSGFSDVDKLHRKPPVSTEQLLHPERYPNDKPVRVEFALKGSDLGGYKVALRNRLGELGMRFLVSPLGQRDQLAKKLANGWGGDRYAYLIKGKSSAFVAAVATDDAAAAKRYRELLQTSFAHRYSKPPTINASGSTVSDGYVLTWKQVGRCLAWVEAPVKAPAKQWLDAASSGCVRSK